MSVLTLRLIACIAMLLDHIGYWLNIMPFRIVGRIAFPIFCYLIYNGFVYTSSPLRYGLRLGIFALISQIPFSLFAYNQLLVTNGNVFVTLLMALLCIWMTERMLAYPKLRWISLVPAGILFLLCHFGVIRSDYDAKGVLMVMVFYLTARWGWDKRLTMFAGIAAECIYGLLSALPSGISTWTWIQCFSLAALPFLLLYNGRKGRLPNKKWAAKAVQYGFYLFYPVHMLVLWFIFFS